MQVMVGVHLEHEPAWRLELLADHRRTRTLLQQRCLQARRFLGLEPLRLHSRDEVIAGVGARLKSVPDLTWQIKDVIVSGDQVTVRGEASGTPAGEFFGAPHTGKSFRVMSIDVHTLDGGRIARSYHIEDWIGAVRQLGAN